MVSLKDWTVISAILVFTILVVYGFLFEAEFGAILSTSWILIILGFILGFAMIFITGVRLYVLCRILHVNIGLFDSVIIRGIGMFVSYITPTLIGGEPVRAILLQRRAGNNSSIGLVSSIVFIETYFDIIICNVLTLLLGFSDIAGRNFKVTLPYLAALYQITSWTTVLFVGFHGVANSKVIGFLSRYTKIGVDKIRFEGEGFRLGFRKMLKPYGLLVLLTSIGSLLVGALTFMLAGFISGCYLSLTTSLKGFVFALSLGVSPLPGGALGVEYGASLIANATTVIMWRFMSYYMILLIGGLITIYAVHRLKIIMPNKNSLKPNNSEANKPDTNIPLNNSNLKLTY
jgi:uncharacterized protein (TIRG00374 family)